MHWGVKSSSVLGLHACVRESAEWPLVQVVSVPSFGVQGDYFFSDLEGAGRASAPEGCSVLPDLLDGNGLFQPKSDMVLVGRLFANIAFTVPAGGRKTFRQRLLDGDYINAAEALEDECFKGSSCEGAEQGS